MVHRAAERLGVEALGGTLIAHPQDHVVEPERLKGLRLTIHLDRAHSTIRNSTPAAITAPLRNPDSRCSRVKASASVESAPAAAAWRTASRATWAAGNTTSQEYSVSTSMSATSPSPTQPSTGRPAPSHRAATAHRATRPSAVPTA